MIERNGWGRWSCSSANKTLGIAARRAGVPAFTVYALRHSYGWALRKTGADLADVQKLLGHRDGRSTLRYAPAVEAKLRAAVDRLDAHEDDLERNSVAAK